MISRVFSVFDSKIGTFARPFVMSTKGEALRSWSDVVNDPQTAFFKHPEDFTLFELGTYDDETGMFLNHQTPMSLGLALDFHKGSYATIGKQEVLNPLHGVELEDPESPHSVPRKSHKLHEVTQQ